MDDKNEMVDPEVARKAFELLQPELLALATLRRVNVKALEVAVKAASIGRFVLKEKIYARFARLSKRLPEEFDVKHVHNLLPAAQAFWHTANHVKDAAVLATNVLVDEELVAHGTAIKERMLKVLEYHLGDRKPILTILLSIRQGGGRLDLASDLSRLARLYQQHVAELERDTRLYRPEDYQDALITSQRIQQQLGDGPSSEENTIDWSDYHRRAWTFLITTYEEVQAAADFLLRHEQPPPSELFPSLYAVPGSGRPVGNVPDNGDDDGGEDDGNNDGKNGGSDGSNLLPPNASAVAGNAGSARMQGEADTPSQASATAAEEPPAKEAEPASKRVRTRSGARAGAKPAQKSAKPAKKATKPAAARTATTSAARSRRSAPAKPSRTAKPKR